MEPRGRERHGWANRKVDMSGSTWVNAGSERVSIGIGDLADEPHWFSSGFGCRNACGVVDHIDIVEAPVVHHSLFNDKPGVPCGIYRRCLRGNDLPFPVIFQPQLFPTKAEAVTLALPAFSNFWDPRC